MRKTIAVVLAALLVGQMARAEESPSIVHITGSNAFSFGGSYATNGINWSVSALSVDITIKQIRDQGDMTNLVKKLAAAGDICAVVGHRWVGVLQVMLEYRLDGSCFSHWECLLCGEGGLGNIRLEVRKGDKYEQQRYSGTDDTK